MYCLTAFLLSLAFIIKVHGLAPAALNPVINLPVLSHPSTLQSIDLSNATNDADLINATSSVVRCIGKDFGYNLNKTSCEEVWKTIPTDSEDISFGKRMKSAFERPLPYRYLSGEIGPTYLRSVTPFAANSSHADEGLCAIDVDHMKNFDFEIATNHDISAAAKSVLDKCVFRDVTKKTGYMPIGGNYPGVGPYSYHDLLTFQNRKSYLYSLQSG